MLLGDGRDADGGVADRVWRQPGDGHRSADAGAGKVYVGALNSVGAFEIPAGSRIDIGGHSYYVVDYAVTSSLAADVAALQDDVAGIDGNLSVATSTV